MDNIGSVFPVLDTVTSTHGRVQTPIWAKGSWRARLHRSCSTAIPSFMTAHNNIIDNNILLLLEALLAFTFSIILALFLFCHLFNFSFGFHSPHHNFFHNVHSQINNPEGDSTFLFSYSAFALV